MLTKSSTLAVENDNVIPARKVSERIRSRLIAARQRYHANDNISAFIENGEVNELHAEVTGHVRELLKALVIDIESDHNTADTAKRIAHMFIDEVFHGRYEPAPTITTFPNVAQLNELMIIGPIKVRSTCSHHLCPILGKVWIGVHPNASSDLMGLSKYARLCDWIMSRPQIQEEAVVMLADELERRIKPDGLAVFMQASHFCMGWRGVKDDGALMKNSIMRGSFIGNTALRHEFLSLMNNHND
jgi:GTP cyclohydrolase I